jgi:hypothetical protein
MIAGGLSACGQLSTKIDSPEFHSRHPRESGNDGKKQWKPVSDDILVRHLRKIVP